MRALPLAFLFVLVACGGAPESAAPPAASATKVTVSVTADPEVMHKADLADGAEDHVVSKCGSCALGMEGDASHAVQVGDYEMHFCSDACQHRMESQPEKVLETVGAVVSGS